MCVRTRARGRKGGGKAAISLLLCVPVGQIQGGHELRRSMVRCEWEQDTLRMTVRAVDKGSECATRRVELGNRMPAWVGGGGGGCEETRQCRCA
jgi:hypothetical protein